MADNEGGRKSPKELVMCSAPDVCQTPMGPATPPVPYQVVGMMSQATGTDATVLLTDQEAFTKASVIPMVIGDEPGVATGVKSGTVKGKAEPKLHSSTVFCSGNPICRHDDLFEMNSGNTVGKLMCMEVGPSGMPGEPDVEPNSIDESGEPTKPTDPPPSPETPAEAAAEEKGLWYQTKGVGKGAKDAVVEMYEGAKTLVTEPGKVIDGLGAAVDNPRAAFDAVTEGYRTAINAGNYGEAIGRAIVDFGGFFIGGGAAAKGVGTTAKVGDAMGDAAKLASKLDDVARVSSAAASKLDEVADVAKVAEKAEEAVAVANKAADASKAAETAAEAASTADKASEAAAAGGKAEKVEKAASASGSAADGAVVKKASLGAAEKGSVADAKFAQGKINKSETFSKTGADKYSEMAGTDIKTVDDLSKAIKEGKISPSQLPVDYVVKDGEKLILNTRTSTALNRAGIPQAEWFGANKTGLPVPGAGSTTFDDLLAGQLKRNPGAPFSSPPR